MRIKVSSITKCILLLIIIMRLSFFKLAGGYISLFATSGDNYPLVMLYMVLIGGAMLSVLKLYRSVSKELRNQIFLAFLAISVGMIISLISNETSFMECCSFSIYYMYVILAVPIAVLLVNNKWDIRKMLCLLVFLCLASYMMRASISMVYGRTGVVVFPNIAEEGTKAGWIRNGGLRVNPPFLGNIFVPVAYYLAKTTWKKSRKALYWALIFVSIWYSYSIHQARSTFMYQIIVLVLIFGFDRMSDKKKLTGIVLLSIALVAFSNSSIFEGLIASFDSNTVTGQSALSRVTTLTYFGQKYLSSPIFGLGFLSGKNQHVLLSVGGHLSDIGLLQSVVLLGIPMILFLVLILHRSIKVILKAKKLNNDKYILLLGMLLLISITGINIDCFSSIYCMSMPIYLALVEYVSVENNRIYVNNENDD